jgi:3',5'-nucleoside bisphosphate phosphatase
VKIDLHLHSNVSDGQLAPAAVLEAAAAAGLSTIALTDHDTAAGVPEALVAGHALGVQVIPGIELSTRSHEAEHHILGYWIDPECAVMRQHQEVALARRRSRMHGMVEKLRGLGVEITFDDVVRAAGPDAQALGRPHLARALHEGGHTRYYGEAFVRYIADGGVAYVSEAFPGVDEAIEMIHAAGGMAVWAHPDPLRVHTLLDGFADMGLDGVECFRPNLTAAEAGNLLQLTLARGLQPTGGSDWHGPGRHALGDFYVQPHEVRGVLDWTGPSRR